MEVSRFGRKAKAKPGDGRSGRSEITLGMTREMEDALKILSEEMGAPVEEVLTQAVGLLLVAVDAQKRDQHLCLTDDELNVKSEIANFGILREGIRIEELL